MTVAAQMLDRRLALDPQVALRPEPFGALAYHYGNRRLIFLKHPDVVRVVRADEHRRQPQPQHDRPPPRHLREARCEAGDEVDAGLHHRRGVQVRADRGRRDHRGR